MLCSFDIHRGISTCGAFILCVILVIIKCTGHKRYQNIVTNLLAAPEIILSESGVEDTVQVHREEVVEVFAILRAKRVHCPVTGCQRE